MSLGLKATQVRLGLGDEGKLQVRLGLGDKGQVRAGGGETSGGGDGACLSRQ